MTETPLDPTLATESDAVSAEVRVEVPVAPPAEVPAEVLAEVPEVVHSRARAVFDAAIATGSLATIATGGALIGLGMREDDLSRVFRLAGRGLLGRVGIPASAVPLTSVAVGYLHHLAIAGLWGFGLGLLVMPLKGITRIVAAIIAAALYSWLSMTFVPAALRIGYSVTSNTPSVVSIGVSLAVALLGGAWLSASDTQG